MNFLYLIAKLSETNDLPEWMLLFAEGTGSIQSGETYLVDRESYNLVAKYVADRGNEIVFDYEHQTIFGGKAPAAGWIKELRYDDGVGIMAKVEWNEEAAGFIAKKEYKYFSPVFGIRESDKRIVGLHSVALTNSPKTNNLQPIVAKLAGMAPAQTEKGDDMKLALLIAKLGLPENATEADVQAKIEELMKTEPKTVEVIAKDVITALDLKEGDDVSTVVASIHALKQTGKHSVSKADFDALEKKLLDRDVTEIVAKAMTDGKVTPDQKDWATQYATNDLEGFKTFVAKAPVVIPKNKLPEFTEDPDTTNHDDTTLTIAKSMGLTKEDLETFGK